MLTEQYQYF